MRCWSGPPRHHAPEGRLDDGAEAEAELQAALGGLVPVHPRRTLRPDLGRRRLPPPLRAGPRRGLDHPGPRLSQKLSLWEARGAKGRGRQEEAGGEAGESPGYRGCLGSRPGPKCGEKNPFPSATLSAVTRVLAGVPDDVCQVRAPRAFAPGSPPPELLGSPTWIFTAARFRPARGPRRWWPGPRGPGRRGAGRPARLRGPAGRRRP